MRQTRTTALIAALLLGATARGALAQEGRPTYLSHEREDVATAVESYIRTNDGPVDRLRGIELGLSSLQIDLTALLLGEAPGPDPSRDGLPSFLRDRGEGVPTSLFGVYIRKGQWLVFPFYEYESNNDAEYEGKELGFSTDTTEYMGESELHQVLLFIGYGVTDDIAIELEFAIYETANLKRASNDTTSGIPAEIDESGFGEVETQVRWRVMRETASRPEVFTFLEIGFPFQDNKVLIGISNWEVGLGLGLVKGFDWGTLTGRISLEYDDSEGELEFGEFAVEYLRRLSDKWQIVVAIEGESDEIVAIVDLQLRLSDRAVFKFNVVGVTEKAPDVAPLIGVIFSF